MELSPQPGGQVQRWVCRSDTLQEDVQGAHDVPIVAEATVFAQVHLVALVEMSTAWTCLAGIFLSHLEEMLPLLPAFVLNGIEQLGVAQVQKATGGLGFQPPSSFLR